MFEYQPKSKVLKMLSDADYCSTITIISPEMDTVCYTLCVATP